MQFLDLSIQLKAIRAEIDDAVKKVLDSGVYIGGAEVENFEKKIADYIGVKHAKALNSGSDALYLALRALGIGRGDEVITTPFSYIATADEIVNAGAKPVFVDIDPTTFNIDCSKIEAFINEKTKAMIPVHLFGQPAEMSEILSIAAKHNLKVIEDAAQAFGAVYDGKKTGSMGDLGCFSFFPSKSLGACGDGGMIVTNNDELAAKIQLLRCHGSSPENKYLNLILGENSRLDAMQAAVLSVKLKYLDGWNKKRIEKAQFYSNNLRDLPDIVVPQVRGNCNHIFHQYTIRASDDKRGQLAEFLKKEGVLTMVYYSIPLHLQPALAFLGHKEGDFIEAEKAAREVLSLPIYPEIKIEDQKKIIDRIRSFANTNA